MPSDSVHLFINPIAGRGRTARNMSRILALFEQAGIALEVHRSTAVGDLETTVRAAIDAGADKIIVAGGDGSIHEAVNGIMHAGGRAALGVVPTGTGNDFAKACAIPLAWEHAAEILANRLSLAATPRRIDVGVMNGRYFANGAGIGLDAKVTSVARAFRWPIGDLVYLVAILRCMLDDLATPRLTIEGDDVQRSGAVTLANVSNGPWIGGMFYIAPMADNTDGVLELIVADPVTRLRILSLLPKLIRGSHLQEAEISHARVRRLAIKAAAPVPWQLDGEVQPPHSEFEIGILPGALNLL